MLIAMFLTLVTLALGIIIMGKGGEANIKNGNRFMRARILLQGAALGFFALAVLTSV